MLTKHSPQEYQKIWGQFDSVFFDFKMSIWGKKVNDFCYTGELGFSIDIANGDIFHCSGRNRIDNLFTMFKNNKDLSKLHKPACKKCPFPHCYNGHIWIVMGCVLTKLKTPTYKQMRDRMRPDGTHWLHPRVANVFTQNILKNNFPRSLFSRWITNYKMRIKNHSFWGKLRHLKFSSTK